MSFIMSSLSTRRLGQISFVNGFLSFLLTGALFYWGFVISPKAPRQGLLYQTITIGNTSPYLLNLLVTIVFVVGFVLALAGIILGIQTLSRQDPISQTSRPFAIAAFLLAFVPLVVDGLLLFLLFMAVMGLLSL